MPATRSQTRLRISMPPPDLAPTNIAAIPLPSPHTPCTNEPYGLPIMSSIRYATTHGLRRQRSSESLGSFVSEESTVSGLSAMKIDPIEWPQDHLNLLYKTLDTLPDHIATPYVGPVPPNNLLHNVSKGIVKDKPLGWPYDVTTTRRKLIELATQQAHEDRERQRGGPSVIDAGGLHVGRRSLARQNSMDFLPTHKAPNRLNRTSKRLQQIDRILDSTYNPYPSSSTHQTATSTTITSTTAGPSIATSLVTPPLVSMPRPLLRTLTDVPRPAATPAVPMPPPLRRTESATSAFDAASQSQPGLKRAPSYGNMELDTPAVLPSPRKRARKDKSARRRRPPSFLGGPLPGIQEALAHELPQQQQQQQQQQAPAVPPAAAPVLSPHTPVRFPTIGTGTPAPAPSSSAARTTPQLERIRTRSQTRADQAQEYADEDAAEQDKENTPSASTLSRRSSKARLRTRKAALESPFDEKKKYRF